MPSEPRFRLTQHSAAAGRYLVSRDMDDPAQAEHAFVAQLAFNGLINASTLRTLLRQARAGEDLSIVSGADTITLQKLRTSGETERNTP